MSAVVAQGTGVQPRAPEGAKAMVVESSNEPSLPPSSSHGAFGFRFGSELLHDLSATARAAQDREHFELPRRVREYLGDEQRRCVEELIESAARARMDLPLVALGQVLRGDT